jgi:L-lactate dehydrogenase
MSLHAAAGGGRVRVGIIGLGWVGASVAVSTLQAGAAHELLLHDVKDGLAEGEAMDLAHGASFYPSASVRAVGIEAMREADAVVISAGRAGTATESRLDLLKDNAALARQLGRDLAGCRGLIVVVTNPVDVLTRIVQEASGLPPERVLGTGTMLDTARLRQIVGRELGVEPRSVHANVVGEHGDSEVVLWSAARVGGVALRRWPGWTAEREQAVADEVRTAAAEVIRRKGATNHAIGMVTAALLKWSLRGERRILTVSRVQEGPLTREGVALSLPAIVEPGGARRVLEPDMDESERAALERSARVLEQAYARAQPA